MAVPGVGYRPHPDPDLTGVRVGVPRNYYFAHVDAEVAAAVRRAIAQLEALGARLIDVDIPMTRYIQAVHWGLMVPEATAYHQATLRTVPELYRADVRILLEAGELMGAGRLPAGAARPDADARRMGPASWRRST
ncbi:amidase family protein [Streptomyces sp. PG2]